MAYREFFVKGWDVHLGTRKFKRGNHDPARFYSQYQNDNTSFFDFPDTESFEPDSTWIIKVYYIKSTGELTIETGHGNFTYLNVPYPIYLNFKSWHSAGQFFNTYVKDVFPMK